MDNSKSFQLIFSFFEAVMNTELGTDVDNQGNYATSKVNAAISRNDGSLEWCHVAPRACVNALWRSRQFVSVDGTRTKSDKSLVLLILTTLDANEEILPLIWGFARNESKGSWLDFLHSFREYFLDNLDATEKKREDFGHLTIVSDRARGLVPAVAEVLPEAFLYHCTQHLAENVRNELGRRIERAFRAACQMETKAKFRALIRSNLFLPLHVTIWTRLIQNTAQHPMRHSSISYALVRHVPTLPSR